ncbi:MAG: cyclomaltodextrinase C-terminal domain-containing protein, partial [Planctomycetota bacterium]
FSELLKNGATAKNIITGEEIILNDNLFVDSKQPLIFEIE